MWVIWCYGFGIKIGTEDVIRDWLKKLGYKVRTSFGSLSSGSSDVDIQIDW